MFVLPRLSPSLRVLRSSLHVQSACGGALWGGGALTAATAVGQGATLSAGASEQGNGLGLDDDEDELADQPELRRRMDEALQRSMDDVLHALGEVEAQDLELDD